MKIYYPPNHYIKSERANLFPLLKPFLKGNEFSDAQRVEMYAISKSDVTFVENLEMAELAILPMSWNYYVSYKKQDLAITFIKQANSLNLKVWMVLFGDYGIKIPEFKNTLVFRANGYRSKLPQTHQGIPVFIEDPLKKQFGTKSVLLKEYHKNPTVGFCGLASNHYGNALKTLIKIAVKNILSHFNLSQKTPEALLAASYLRSTCLKKLQQHPEIKDNFIIRKKYRAGAKTQAQRKQSTAEFYNNMKNSDYILCVRGAGNFSVRLYETLAMGRIPIYIHTNGLLPLENTIKWKEHVVWVNYNEVDKIAEKVLAFHQNLNPKTFSELCKKNRMLWETKLQTGSFFKTIINTA